MIRRLAVIRGLALPRASSLLPLLLALLSGLLVAKVAHRLVSDASRVDVAHVSDIGNAPSSSSRESPPVPSQEGSTAPDDAHGLAVRCEGTGNASGLEPLRRIAGEGHLATAAQRAGDDLALARACSLHLRAAGDVLPPAWSIRPPFAPRAPPPPGC